jgi:hypothetical protein
MSPRAGRTRATVIVGAWLALHAFAQAGLAGPHDYDAKAARAGQLTTVLLRVEAIFNDEPEQVYGTLFSPLPQLANMDDRVAPEPVRLKAFGKVPGAADGWIAMSLPPGHYFLLLQPTGWPLSPPSSSYDAARNVFRRVVQSADRAGAEDLTTFWFPVPAATPVLYVGTIVMRCRGEKKSAYSIQVAHCDDYVVVQEPERAAAEAAALLPGGTAPVSMPLLPYGVPRAPRDDRRAARIALTIESAGGLAGAAYTPATDVKGTFIYSPDPITLLVGNLVALVTEHAMQSHLDSEVAAKTSGARACVDALSNRVRDFDLDGALRTAFASQLAGRLANDDDAAQSDSLAVSVDRFQLRECRERFTLCTDLVLHLRLADPASGAVRLDERLAYTSAHSVIVDPFKAGPRLYERTVAPAARCTALADWCSTDGPKLLAEEIQRGLDAIARQLVRDLDAARDVAGAAL